MPTPACPATVPARRPAALLAALLLLAACSGGAPSTTPAPAGATILDVRSGRPITRDALLRRLQSAQFVLLGEVHDNAEQHAARAALIEASAGRRPALVFEHFPASRDSVLATKPAGAIEDWLDAAGFDRKGWRWPLHRPLVDAALRLDLPRYGSLVERERLRPVMRGGAVPEPYASLVAKVPLGADATAALDRTLVEGHCGELPAEMVAPLRLAQEVRDASMTDALLRAQATGHPAWLLAGNGHVGRDYGVPRFLAALRPDAATVVVGFLERAADGSLPPAAERAAYDVVWVTGRAEREDPCAAMRRMAPPAPAPAAPRS